ncbi:ferritin-like fold-containing protein [Micromonospora zamorensis]|uniref:ferritin-like fold-containing protein n=1 Tax=Micromonospora zamorensis TaxID=709883 RepID=UPI0037B2CAE7
MRPSRFPPAHSSRGASNCDLRHVNPTRGLPLACARVHAEHPRSRAGRTASGGLLDVLHDSRYADFAAAEIRVAVADDSRVASRLSIRARRLVGEALSQASRFRRRAGRTHRADRAGRPGRRAGAVRQAHRRAHSADGRRRAEQLTVREAGAGLRQVGRCRPAAMAGPVSGR